MNRQTRWLIRAMGVVGLAALGACGQGDSASRPSAPSNSIVAPFPNDAPADVPEIGEYQLSFAFDELAEYGAPLQDLAIVGDLVAKTYGQADDPSQYYDDQLLIVRQARACVEDVLVEGGEWERPAVIFDVDETTLSSFWMLQVQDFGFNEWLQNSLYTLAKNPAIEPVRDWFNELIDLGVQPIVITGRSETETPLSPIDGSTSTYDIERATIDNLRSEGYATGGPHNSDPDDYVIFFKPAGYAGSTAMFKAETRVGLRRQFDIVGNLGDQFGDLGDGADATPEVCAYKLPNPFYFVGE